MGNTIQTAVTNAAKKVYYVLRSRNFGWVGIPKIALGVSAVYGSVIREGLNISIKDRALATRFNTVTDLLTEYGRHGVYNGTYSSGLEIVRVEETPGTPSRRVATCSETPTGYVIKDGAVYLTDPTGPLGMGWNDKLEAAVVFSSESAAISSLTQRSVRLGVSYSSTIVRVIDVPATPVITETVLS